MRKILRVLAIAVMFFTAANVSALTINTSDIPLSTQCIGVKGADLARSADKWNPQKWGVPEITRWSPLMAGIKPMGPKGKDGVKVRLVFSEEDIRFYKQSVFLGTNTRIPYALELDVVDQLVDQKNVYPFTRGIYGFAITHDFKIASNNLPQEAMLREDVSASDSVNQMSAIIARPDLLKPYTVYEIVFQSTLDSSQKLGENVRGKLCLNLQLSVNYKWLATMYGLDHGNASEKCDLLVLMWKIEQGLIKQWWQDLVKENGSIAYDELRTLIIGSYGANIPSDAIHGWYYFIAADTDRCNEMVIPFKYDDKGKIIDSICFNDRENFYHNRSSHLYCRELFALSVGATYGTLETRPEYSVVKFIGDPNDPIKETTVYLSSGGKLWPILDENVYTLLGFRKGCPMTPDWSCVKEFPKSKKGEYLIRPEILPSANDPFKAKMIAYKVVKPAGYVSCMSVAFDSSKIYLFNGKNFRHIKNEADYYKLGYSNGFTDVVKITPELFAYYGEGHEVNLNDYLISDSNPFPISLSYDDSQIIECKVAGYETVKENTGTQYVATALYQNGNVRDITNSVSWDVSYDEARIDNGYLKVPSVSSTMSCEVRAVYAAASGSYPVTIKKQSPYTFLRSTSCTYADKDSPYLPSNEKDIFSEGDPVYFWLELNNLYVSVNVRVDFYQPDGKFYYSHDFGKTDDPKNAGYDYYYWWRLWVNIFNIGENDAENSGLAFREGKWTVKVYVDSQLVDTNYFTVKYNNAKLYYRDSDDDGYSNGTTLLKCTRPSGYKLASELISTSGDCDDNNSNIHKGAKEICNGTDDNCDGKIDEGFNIGHYLDGWHTYGTSRAFLDCYNNFSGKIGLPFDNGGSIYVHRVGIVWAQDFRQDIDKPHYGDDGKCCLILNEIKGKAFLLKEGFWGKYKEVWGFDNLGAPYNNEYSSTASGLTIIRQDFEKGYITWNGKTVKVYWGSNYAKLNSSKDIKISTSRTTVYSTEIIPATTDKVVQKFFMNAFKPSAHNVALPPYNCVSGSGQGCVDK